MAKTVVIQQLTVACLVLTTLAKMASGESFFLTREHTDRLRYMRTENHNQVATELDAAVSCSYLQLATCCRKVFLLLITVNDTLP